MTDVLIVEGTGATNAGAGTDQYELLADLASRLDVFRFRPVSIAYPAAYGAPMSFADSVDEGVRNLQAAIDKAEGPVYVVGYSQGAVVAGLFAGHPKVIHTYLIADPARRAGDYVGGRDPGGYGIMGERAPWPNGASVSQLAAPGDPITGAAPDSLLRDVADLTPAMSLDFKTWFADMADVLKSGDTQNYGKGDGLLTWLRRVRDSVREVGAYMFGGRHTCYAVENIPGLGLTYTQWVAWHINSAGKAAASA